MALCWPLQLPPKAKAVLISMADNANDQGECWPSISTIAERTCLCTRSVMRAIQELEAFKVMFADRTNGRHTTYKIVPESYSKPVTGSHRCQSDTSDTESPTSDRQSRDQCQAVTGPVTGSHTNRKEPSRTVIEPSAQTAVDELLKDIDPVVLRDFKQMRSKQKAPITETSIRGFIREAQKAGITLEDAIRTSTENSWRGFKADWLNKGQGKSIPIVEPKAWHETRSGVEKRAGQLGLYPWDQQTETWEEYKRRVLRADRGIQPNSIEPLIQRAKARAA